MTFPEPDPPIDLLVERLDDRLDFHSQSGETGLQSQAVFQRRLARLTDQAASASPPEKCAEEVRCGAAAFTGTEDRLQESKEKGFQSVHPTCVRMAWSGRLVLAGRLGQEPPQ